jgi:hypothetical protein
VQYSLTQSLPDYCNVRPGLSLQATVAPGEYPEEVFAELLALARAECERLVDEALEQVGKAPRYYAGPRFWLWRADRYVLVLPVNVPGPEKTRERRGYEYHYQEILDREGYPWQTAVRLAREHADDPDGDVVLCADGTVPPEVLADLETAPCRECGARVAWSTLAATKGYCPECAVAAAAQSPF